jgi:hypothetical protein
MAQKTTPSPIQIVAHILLQNNGLVAIYSNSTAVYVESLTLKFYDCALSNFMGH